MKKSKLKKVIRGFLSNASEETLELIIKIAEERLMELQAENIIIGGPAWICEKCNTMNTNEFSYCQICHKKRPKNPKRV